MEIDGVEVGHRILHGDGLSAGISELGPRMLRIGQWRILHRPFARRSLNKSRALRWSLELGEYPYFTVDSSVSSECPRNHSRLHPHSHNPGFASPLCPVPIHRVSSRPGRVAGGVRNPGSACDMTETETAGRHDPGDAIQSVR